VGSATFGKAERMASPSKSPGPGDYKEEQVGVKGKAPRVLFAKDEKRFDYIQATCSPGPGRYYPVRRFVSK